MDNHKLHVEEKLKMIGDLELVHLKSIDDPNLFPCDLLILTSEQVPEEEFYNWLVNYSKRIHRQSSIKIPTVVISEVSFFMQKKFMLDAVKSNWYFDIVSKEHLESLPIRITNLLRIHDHIHEIHRYENSLISLQEKVDLLSQQIVTLTKGAS